MVSQQSKEKCAVIVRQRHSSPYRLIIIVLISTISGLILSYSIWLPSIAGFLVIADPLHPADAVIPLAGGVERAEYAARLYQDGYAPWFVATDIKQPLDWDTYLSADTPIARIALEQGVAQQHIVTTSSPVTSTYTEALAVSDLAQREGWQSLIVVTNPAHTRRSRAIFRTVFTGTDIAVSIRPAIGEGEGEADAAWWCDEHERGMVGREYVKLMAFYTGMR